MTTADALLQQQFRQFILFRSILHFDPEEETIDPTINEIIFGKDSNKTVADLKTAMEAASSSSASPSPRKKANLLQRQ